MLMSPAMLSESPLPLVVIQASLSSVTATLPSIACPLPETTTAAGLPPLSSVNRPPPAAVLVIVTAVVRVEGQVADARGRGKQIHRAAGVCESPSTIAAPLPGKPDPSRPVARRRPGGCCRRCRSRSTGRVVLDRQFRRRLRGDGASWPPNRLAVCPATFIAQHDPAEIRGRAVEPLLHVGQHGGTGRTRPGKGLIRAARINQGRRADARH